MQYIPTIIGWGTALGGEIALIEMVKGNLAIASGTIASTALLGVSTLITGALLCKDLYTGVQAAGSVHAFLFDKSKASHPETVSAYRIVVLIDLIALLCFAGAIALAATGVALPVAAALGFTGSVALMMRYCTVPDKE